MKRRITGSTFLSPINMQAPHGKIMVLAVISLMMLLGALYLQLAWNGYQHMAESEALQLARSVEALLHIEHMPAPASNSQPKTIPEDSLLAQSLVRLVESTDSIYYAYVLQKQNENTVLVADSAAAESGTFQAMRCGCEEAAEINQLPFELGQDVLTKPVSSPCGAWIRALVPIYDFEYQAVTAVLGLSYSAIEWRVKLWKRMAPDIIMIVCMLVLAFTLFNLRQKNLKLKKNAGDLAFQESLYRNVFCQAPIGIILQERKKSSLQTEYISINPTGETILGRRAEELKNIPWTELTHEEDLKAELAQFQRFMKGEINSYSMEKRLIKPDGSTVWTNITVADFSGSPLYDSMYLCLLEDISARKQSEEALRESERSKSVFLSHLPGMAYRCRYDQSWTMKFVSEGCHTLTGYQAEELIDNQAVSFDGIISSEYRQSVRNEWNRILPQHTRFHDEYEIITKSGERKWVLELGQGIYDSQGNVEALEGIVLDISEGKKKEHQIAYLRNHDFLTGLYNRSYMDMEKKRLGQPEYGPLSIAIFDIDGLRMINDAYGHAEGDRLIFKVANLIQSCRRIDDVLGRVSGGEFMLLLPHTHSEAARRLMREIQDKIDSYNRARKEPLYAINLSIGFGTKESQNQSVDAVIKSAEEYLKRRKLLNQNSSHSAIVSSIMATLYAKSQETEEHGQRLGELCRAVGERLGLEQKSLDDLQLLSKLHDIGKIGIDDRILNKPGKLTEEEWKEMKQHPEIGFRIAMATPQLEHIAEYILHHHERWDGTGYPMGFKGPEIPVISRILAIADAYDAMTEDRIYRKALPRETALKEIEQNAGAQFDPGITKLFVGLMTGESDYFPCCPIT